MAKRNISADIDTASLDEAIEKANRLVELLQEASNIVDSLSGKDLKNLVSGKCTAQ